MRNPAFALLIGAVSVAALATGPVSALAQMEKSPTQKLPTPGDEGVKDPMAPSYSGGAIPLAEETWTSVFADEPALAFERASKEIGNGNLKQAGHFILKAAEHTRIAAYRSKDELKDTLFGLERQLRESGESLKEGKSIPKEDLFHIFAQDLDALAQHHLVNADKYWLEDKEVKAGTDLGAAVYDMNQSLLWETVTLDEYQRNLLAEGRSTADALIASDTKPVPDKDQVARVISGLTELVSRMSVEG